jgi:predicted DNA binding protein
MSLFGEFHLSAGDFAFHEAFQVDPSIVIEIERVVASEDVLTPYFWVSNVAPESFEAATQDDPSLEQVQRLDEFEEATLFRANWADRVETLVYAYTHIGATILDAEGNDNEWEFRMRFDDREKLNDYYEYLNDNDVSFELQRLYEISHPGNVSQFGLTPKQSEALTTALEMGFFDLPRDATMEEIADELDIAPQSLSDRLRRAEKTLFEEALHVDGPSSHGFVGSSDS